LQRKEPHGLIGRESPQSSYRLRPAQPHGAMPAEVETRAARGSSRVIPERAQQQRRKNARSASGKTRRWITWTIGGSAALLGFIGVLRLTDPVAAPHNPAIAALATAAVSDATSLMAAVQTAGLRGAANIQGSIEEIKRLGNGLVTIKGWVRDGTASGSALTIVAYAGGKHVLTTATEGARFDIAMMLGLTDASPTNLPFQGAFACRAGEKIIVIAVTSGAAYSQFRSLACP
jgi:hypothetical protein